MSFFFQSNSGRVRWRNGCTIGSISNTCWSSKFYYTLINVPGIAIRIAAHSHFKFKIKTIDDVRKKKEYNSSYKLYIVSKFSISHIWDIYTYIHMLSYNCISKSA